MIFCTIAFLSIFLSLSLSLYLTDFLCLSLSLFLSLSLSINSSSSPLFYQTFTRRRPLSPEEEKRTCTDTITGIHYTLYAVHVQTLLLAYIIRCTRADTITGIHYTHYTLYQTKTRYGHFAILATDTTSTNHERDTNNCWRQKSLAAAHTDSRERQATPQITYYSTTLSTGDSNRIPSYWPE